MALLWRTSEPLSRGRRAATRSVDQIVHAAIAIADADGVDGLSIRRVAERLSVAPMSLYTYVPGRAELLDLMLDQVYGETARPPLRSTRWREALDVVARENHALYLRHPWMVQVATSRPVLGPNLIAKYDYELGALDGIGLDDVEMDDVLALVLSFVHGAARDVVDAANLVRGTGLTEQQWWDASAPHLDAVFDPSRHPLAARVGTAAGQARGAAYDPAHGFEFGLARLLDGVGTYLSGETAGFGGRGGQRARGPGPQG